MTPERKPNFNRFNPKHWESWFAARKTDNKFRVAETTYAMVLVTNGINPETALQTAAKHYQNSQARKVKLSFLELIDSLVKNLPLEQREPIFCLSITTAAVAQEPNVFTGTARLEAIALVLKNFPPPKAEALIQLSRQMII